MIMEVYNSADYTDWDNSKQKGVEGWVMIHPQTQTRSYSKY